MDVLNGKAVVRDIEVAKNAWLRFREKDIVTVDSPALAEFYYANIPKWLAISSYFYWTTGMFRLCTTDAEKALDGQKHTLLHPSPQLHVFEKFLDLKVHPSAAPEDIPEEMREYDASIVSMIFVDAETTPSGRRGTGLVLLIVYAKKDQPHEIHLGAANFFVQYDEPVPGSDSAGIMAIAMQMFMKQPMVDTPLASEVATFTGGHRSRAKNDARKVRVVYLRRHGESHSKKDGETKHVDWQCQWICNVGWRNQWYPSLQAHKPVFVPPFIKGPEDKPLRTHDKSIYAVVR